MEFGVAADIFHADGHLNKVTHPTNIAGRFLGYSPRIGHRQEIMGVAAVDAAPAKVIGEPGRLGAFYQGFELFEMLAVRAVSGAEIHRDAVLDHSVLFEDLIKHLQRSSTVAHEIFGDNLKPIDYGLLFQNVPAVRHAKTNADAVIGEIIEGIGWHIFESKARGREKGDSR